MSCCHDDAALNAHHFDRSAAPLDADDYAGMISDLQQCIDKLSHVADDDDVTLTVVTSSLSRVINTINKKFAVPQSPALLQPLTGPVMELDLDPRPTPDLLTIKPDVFEADTDQPPEELENIVDHHRLIPVVMDTAVPLPPPLPGPEYEAEAEQKRAEFMENRSRRIHENKKVL